MQNARKRSSLKKSASFTLATIMLCILLLSLFSPRVKAFAYVYDGIIDGAKTITAEGTFHVIGTHSVDSSDGLIKINTSAPVTLVLDDASYTTKGSHGTNIISPLALLDSANVTIIIMDGTTNSFICDGTSYNTNAGQAGISVPLNATLTIKGEANNTGRLNAWSGDYSAGIGGGANSTCGTITIEGGNIDAQARKKSSSAGAENGAGIGGGGGNTVATICMR